MDTTDLVPFLDSLDDDIDGLEVALAPLTKFALTDVASKLPLLDKAQLFVLVTYAIETILFSYLRLHNIDAKEHPVFRELTRIKQYFQKINNVENVSSKRENLSLDKAAAGRMIKHALREKNQYGLERKEQRSADGQQQTQGVQLDEGQIVTSNEYEQSPNVPCSIGSSALEGPKLAKGRSQIKQENYPRKKRKT